MTVSAILALQDGTIFKGLSIGAQGLTTGEVVFNTSMTGYQEILTDPSYARQIITLTYPHIGNTGMNAEDEEASTIHASGLIIRDLPLLASSWRNEMSLQEYLVKNNLVAISDIDTRQLTRLLREKGAQKGAILAGDDLDETKAIAAAKDFAGLSGMDLAKEVSTTETYEWTQSVWALGEGYQQANDLRYHVVAYDYGVKKNILCMLAERGARVTVVPAQTSAEEVLALNPDGVFLSNGPGDPEPCDYAIEAIQQVLEKDIPVFGICLGHQLLSLASGAKTEKMKFGHHGANHPVQDLDSGVVMITSQNHGFAVDESSLPDNLKATHRSLFDGSLQAVHRTDKPAFSFQGHPEASPGPHDVAPLFDHFFELIEQNKQGGAN
ncbi:MAG: glutamine-hydrolyzing carbamoyl-phosphate synthase small subunit [Gammaproteobacteria bacterium]|nr:glutamine-hydrolyzing carbamoyl-phosphate synthase small subunit [Gammaproteobacteria bacterium]MBT4087619.1 glutamine-hydrolyzing carbamoyl-phosphate synthase small subunit [Deltaproteobacteria bacterium]MBT3723047.1 glutamine-hydrolyzing carbamoyl-phosphate synthase small subunit [Gammaproteobacteria bacterium]MBT4196746.1 glutamine-hydrolyzing carbamoyl-phosphate synthase small subunit [Gammaproteobacteria bacterium]MBT4451865.1 glutamine-hydrolyzing carbamoyl-phosphate synthase small sub